MQEPPSIFLPGATGSVVQLMDNTIMYVCLSFMTPGGGIQLFFLLFFFFFFLRICATRVSKSGV